MSISAFLHPTLDSGQIVLGDGSQRSYSIRIPDAEFSTPFWVRLDGERVIRIDSLPYTLNVRCGSIELLSTLGGGDPGPGPDPGSSFYAPFALEVLYPQSDAVTNSFARHRHAHPDMLYQIPIGVQGGAWPYHYEVIEGPAWLDIIHEELTFDPVSGTYEPEFGYGILSGTAPSTPQGAENVVVRVTDMNREFVDVQFSVTVSTTPFAHVDQENGSDVTGDGTIGNPYQTIYHLMNGTSTSARNNKIVVVHGDTYVMADHSVVGSAGQWSFATNQPCAYISSDGQVIDVDGQNARRAITNGGKSDVFASGFNFIDFGQNNPGPNTRVIHAAASWSRSVWWNLHCVNPTTGTAGTDNPGFIVLFRPGIAGHNRVYMVDCSATDLPRSQNGSNPYTWFTVKNALAERNVWTRCNGIHAMHMKDSQERATHRANTIIECNTTHTGIGPDFQDNDFNTKDIEVSYNKIDGVANRGLIGVNSGFFVHSWLTTSNIHIFRNSVRGSITNNKATVGPAPEVFARSNVSRNLNGIYEEDLDNLTTGVEDPFDANINLVEPYRGEYLGLRGAEITAVPNPDVIRPIPGDAIILLDSDTNLQTIVGGWQGHAQMGTDPALWDDLANRAVEELGLTSIRIEVRSGDWNTQDIHALFNDGTLTGQQNRDLRYAPRTGGTAQTSFTAHDIDMAVERLRPLLDARGESLYTTLCLVDFNGQGNNWDVDVDGSNTNAFDDDENITWSGGGGQLMGRFGVGATQLRIRRTSGTGPGSGVTVTGSTSGQTTVTTSSAVQRYAGDFQLRENPAIAANLILSIVQWMDSTYGYVPDSIEIMLEPDLTSANWSGAQLAAAVKAIGDALAAENYDIPIWTPSTTNAGQAVGRFTTVWDHLPGEGHPNRNYVTGLTYHRYGSSNISHVQAIGAEAASKGVMSGMLEWIGADGGTLHADLKWGLVGTWQQFAVGFDGGGTGSNDKYYALPSGVITMTNIARRLQQYFRFVRRGAVRKATSHTDCGSLDSTDELHDFDGLAFENVNGKYVVVVRTRAVGDFWVDALPPGVYGIEYTQGSTMGLTLPDVAVFSGDALPITSPSSTVTYWTIFQR